MKYQKTLIAAALLAMTTPLQAGGLLTNTNQSIAFNRNFARVGAIGIDGVYFNPAGVVFLDQGFHLSLNFQNVYQTREITSSFTVPAFQQIPSLQPFSQPFLLNGGQADGSKFYKGKASVPILPSFQVAYNKDRWSFQAGFGLTGGGGKATFNDGLPSFERQVSLLPALINQQLPAFAQLLGQQETPATSYSMQSYMSGQQYDFGLQLGVAYKVNEHLSVYGGARFNYIYNKYEGNITDISANVGGNNQNLYGYFDAKAKALGEKANVLQAQAAAAQTQAAAYQAQANAATDPTVKAQLQGAADQYAAGAKRASEGAKLVRAGADKLNSSKELVKDRYVDVRQRGWGITPVLGIDYRSGKWNLAARYEFTTKFNIENDTKRDDTHHYENGVNTPNDLPGILALGAQYEVLKNLRVMAGYNYYFDKDARMDNNKQRFLKKNTQEFLAGVEWDVTPAVTVSAGGQRTLYGLGDGKYLTDLSFVTSSYSFGFGAKVKVARNIHLNVAYFFTDYSNFKKEYNDAITVGSQQVTQPDGTVLTQPKTIATKNTDIFTRTNKVLGVGLDIDF
ncbi:hypothetical protein [Prevotella multiformis]|uniref:Outer membrane protein transport protein, Ompp1/FadL/TodX family n=1 Tax=Prevotella multiformis DSM 16608 TaxID=888743 RepID=F0F733_9BACT|nr:hypothetical protein [Prevotella multiformis]EGC20160.1 outer membrane protein transport protein, Ompp1/FadL/TodX family [Prevotella multiformis DSM 16608]